MSGIAPASRALRNFPFVSLKTPMNRILARPVVPLSILLWIARILDPVHLLWTQIKLCNLSSVTTHLASDICKDVILRYTIAATLG
jgi:hypothetical protein